MTSCCSVDSASWTLQIVVKEESLESSFKSKACVLISLSGVVLGGANPSLRTVYVLPMLFPFLKASLSQTLFQTSPRVPAKLVLTQPTFNDKRCLPHCCFLLPDWLLCSYEKENLCHGWRILWEALRVCGMLWPPDPAVDRHLPPEREEVRERGVGCAEAPSPGSRFSLLLNGSFIWLAIWFI